MREKTILIVDDEPVLRLGLKEQLRSMGYVTEECADLTSARQRLRAPAPSLVLLDLQLPDGTGLELLPRVREEWPETPVVMMTAHGSVKSAVEAMRIGAYTYLQKPLDTSELQVVLQNAIETGRLRRQVADRADRESRRFGFDAIIGKSTAMRRVLDQSRTVAESPASTVLLFGESGVGKGLIARAIHYASARASSPLLTVTCSAIPENLLEAELFGHEKGAFTDAKTRRRGVFEAADGGTVFLDEIGDMPPALQAKLLGVLEERSFHRIGSTETLRVDVRIVAATHRDLANEVQQGRFREDLYYRLRVVPIVIPPLRERVADILPLARSFVQRFNGEFDRAVDSIHEDAGEQLKTHAWPGNVRELRNVIEHAMLFVKGDTLMPDNLLLEPGYHPHGDATPAAGTAGDPFSLPAEGVKLEDVEQTLVKKALERSGGNKSRAAKLLGISRDQIRYRIEKMEAKK